MAMNKNLHYLFACLAGVVPLSQVFERHSKKCNVLTHLCRANEFNYVVEKVLLIALYTSYGREIHSFHSRKGLRLKITRIFIPSFEVLKSL